MAAEIAENGTYLRTRSYTDMSTEAALEASEQLLRSASLMEELHGRLESRTAELREWRETFRRGAERKLEELVGTTTGRLRSDMVSFAERHWRQSREIGDLWNQKVEETRINERLQAGLQELLAEMRNHLKEIETDISTELQLVAGINTSFSGEGIGSPNLRRWTRWATTAIGAVTGVIGSVLMFVPGAQGLGIALGLAGGGLAALGRFVSNRFKSEDQRRREAVSKFCDQARPQLNDTEARIKQVFRQNFREEIDGRGAGAAVANMSRLSDSAKRAAGIIRDLGTNQQSSLMELNMNTATQTLLHIGCQEDTPLIDRAARVPGQALALVVARNKNLSEEAVVKMESLLKEKVSVIRKGTTPGAIIRNATRSRAIRTDGDTGTAGDGLRWLKPAGRDGSEIGQSTDRVAYPEQGPGVAVDRLQTQQWSDETEALLGRAMEALTQSTSETVREMASTLVIPGETEESPIRIAFAGQYGSGKSTLIRALTGRSDIHVGAGITTDQVQDYPWNGIIITDTPGIHTSIRPEHDEASYRAISQADLQMFVITNELFDEHIGQHYRRLTIDNGKAHETIVVVNKMDRHSLGNSTESRAIITEALREPLRPFSPEDMRITFTDANSALDANNEPDVEIAGMLREQGNMNALADSLNDLIRDKGLASRHTTRLYSINQVLNQALEMEESGDSEADALLLVYNQNIRAITQSATSLRGEVNLAVGRAKGRIREAAHEVNDILDSERNGDRGKQAEGDRGIQNKRGHPRTRYRHRQGNAGGPAGTAEQD